MTSSPNASDALRADLTAALGASDWRRAMQLARHLTASQAGMRHVSFVVRTLEKANLPESGLKKLRVALLSSFSIEFLRPHLILQAFLSGIQVDIYVAGFDQFQQEIRNPGSNLYSFAPDVVILAVEGEAWLPEIYSDGPAYAMTGFDEVIRNFANELRNLVAAFRRHSTATLLINNLVVPAQRQLGVLDAQSEFGQRAGVAQANDQLAEVARASAGVFAFDYERVVSYHGAAHWYDQRMSFYASAPVSMSMLPKLASEYLKYFRAVSGLAKKCLVLDLDNTLWGGVIGEDGLSGIALDTTYPGNAFRAFQREIANLQKRGVILAVASKNNLGDVEEVFDKHPHMILKAEHFSAMEVHWKPKSVSLELIARKLNISLEHMVFVDDNPAECAEVSQHLPMVTVIQLPKQPELYVAALHEHGWFDTISLSKEDQRRGDLYKQRDLAETMREQSASLDDFLQGLQMEIVFAPVTASSLARSVQLTQKTNQLNATTLRLNASDITSRMNDSSRWLTAVTVKDRFGDNGIVGLTISRLQSRVMEIELFLLSCRVIGRNVETAMLAHLCDQALRRDASELRGKIVPTAKNIPVRDVFERHGFEKLEELLSGETTWRLDLPGQRVAWPRWIKVRDEEAVATKP